MQSKSLSICSLFLDSEQKLQLVNVLISCNRGLPDFQIIGGADKTVREAKIRVKQAISNSTFNYPRCKIVVNLQPAALPKKGTSFDLPIALGILALSKQITLPYPLLCYGELSLDGEVLAPLNSVAAKFAQVAPEYMQQLSLLLNRHKLTLLAAATDEVQDFLAISDPERRLTLKSLNDLREVLNVPASSVIVPHDDNIAIGSTAAITPVFADLQNTSADEKVQDMSVDKGQSERRIINILRQAQELDLLQERQKNSLLTSADLNLYRGGEARELLGKLVPVAAERWKNLQMMTLAKYVFVLCLAGGHSLLLVGANGSGKSELASTAVYFLYPELAKLCERELPPGVAEFYKEISCNITPGMLRKTLGCRQSLNKNFMPDERLRGCVLADELNQFRKDSLLQLQLFLEYSQKMQNLQVSPRKRYIVSPGELQQAERAAPLRLQTAIEALHDKEHFVDADFLQLIFSMNPCPCGNYLEMKTLCSCSPTTIKRYNRRLQQALLDRIQVYIRTYLNPDARGARGEAGAAAATTPEVADKVAVKLRQTVDIAVAELETTAKVVADKASQGTVPPLTTGGGDIVDYDIEFIRTRILQCRAEQRRRNYACIGRACLNAELSYLEINKLQTLQKDMQTYLELLRNKGQISFRRELFIRLFAQTLADFTASDLQITQLLTAANYCKLPGELYS